MNDGLISSAALQAAALTPDGRLQSLLDMLQTGGPVVLVLLLMSVTGLTIIVLKLWQFQALQPGAIAMVEQAMLRWREGEADCALELLKPLRNPVAKVLSVAMQATSIATYSEGEVREEAARVANAELEKMRSNLRVLELIASLSPLLGLLGTVLGMIEAFQQLQAAGNRVDPGVLSGGIWEALLTTAVGLGVAIPAVAALSGLERVVERTRHRMEDALTRVFTADIAFMTTSISEGEGKGATASLQTESA